jgi:hypothetical protein
MVYNGAQPWGHYKWQVTIKEKHKFKTTFNVPADHYEWNVMPFGLKNVPSKFQRVMDDTLKPYFD